MLLRYAFDVLREVPSAELFDGVTQTTHDEKLALVDETGVAGS
jgi:hypothetical protein